MVSNGYLHPFYLSCPIYTTPVYGHDNGNYLAPVYSVPVERVFDWNQMQRGTPPSSICAVNPTPSVGNSTCFYPDVLSVRPCTNNPSWVNRTDGSNVAYAPNQYDHYNQTCRQIDSNVTDVQSDRRSDAHRHAGRIHHHDRYHGRHDFDRAWRRVAYDPHTIRNDQHGDTIESGGRADSHGMKNIQNDSREEGDSEFVDGEWNRDDPATVYSPIYVFSTTSLTPLKSFETLDLNRRLRHNMISARIFAPTLLQSHCLPYTTRWMNVMISARSRSGRTVACALSIVHKVLSERLEAVDYGAFVEPRVVVVCSTDERAMKICKVSRELAVNCGIGIGVLPNESDSSGSDGLDRWRAHIVVGTAERTLAQLRIGNVRLCSVECVVLFEAERLLKTDSTMRVVERILTHGTVPRSRRYQTILISNELSEHIRFRASKFVMNYTYVTATYRRDVYADVQHRTIRAILFRTMRQLFWILNMNDSIKTLVFVDRERVADRVARFLSLNGVASATLGDRTPQEEVHWRIDAFRRGETNVLIMANDFCRRADVGTANHVINYNGVDDIATYFRRLEFIDRDSEPRVMSTFFYCGKITKLADDLTHVLENANSPVARYILFDRFNYLSFVESDRQRDGSHRTS